jgi:D-alanine-D-alanine ligase
VLGSALGMDKLRTKWLWQSVDVPTPPWSVIETAQQARNVAECLGLPAIMKPVHEGSSVGMTKVTRVEDLVPAWELARRCDVHVIAERWIQGGEYTAGILGTEVLPLIRLETPRVFYDYEAKYGEDAGTRYILPCGLESADEAALRDLSLRAFEAVGGRCWGRTDFLLDEHGEPWFIEVNTAPGMTNHSLVPMAAAARGIDYDELVWRILEMTL